MPFRYSGSKKRLLKYLPTPPKNTKIIIEPFAGSLAYSLKHKPEVIIASEANELVRNLLEWLATTATVEILQEMIKIRPKENIDLRQIYLGAPLTLMRLQTSSVYVGQLSSYIHYTQHKTTGILDIIKQLDYIKKALTLPILNDFVDTFYHTNNSNTMVFLDPPYDKTSANYKGKSNYDKVNYNKVEEYFINCSCPIFMTYGDGAKETFPQLTWEKLVTRKVPNIRNGGTINRVEWIAYKGF